MVGQAISFLLSTNCRCRNLKLLILSESWDERVFIGYCIPSSLFFAYRNTNFTPRCCVTIDMTFFQRGKKIHCLWESSGLSRSVLYLALVGSGFVSVQMYTSGVNATIDLSINILSQSKFREGSRTTRKCRCINNRR